MRNFIYGTLLVILVVGCHSVPRSSVQPVVNEKVVTVPISLTFMQCLYIWKYESYRSKGLEKFGLPADATLEDFRPHIATMLGLPDIVSILGILSHPEVKKILSEDRRHRIIQTFDLSPESSWLEIYRFAEYIRIHRPQTP